MAEQTEALGVASGVPGEPFGGASSVPGEPLTCFHSPDLRGWARAGAGFWLGPLRRLWRLCS